MMHSLIHVLALYVDTCTEKKRGKAKVGLGFLNTMLALYHITMKSTNCSWKMCNVFKESNFCASISQMTIILILVKMSEF